LKKAAEPYIETAKDKGQELKDKAEPYLSQAKEKG
jgi:hypothetical protein